MPSADWPNRALPWRCQIRSIHAVFRDHPVPPIEFLRLGGDIFHDLVVHDADFIMHLLQEVPDRVSEGTHKPNTTSPPIHG